MTCSGEDLFFGAVTVGERGQVVIPAEVRKSLNIQPGDRLVVFLHPMGQGVVLSKIEGVQHFLATFQEAIEKIRQDGASPGEEED
jgi:AbrB family looped-hinge helix DNA binding protein